MVLYPPADEPVDSIAGLKDRLELVEHHKRARAGALEERLGEIQHPPEQSPILSTGLRLDLDAELLGSESRSWPQQAQGLDRPATERPLEALAVDLQRFFAYLRQVGMIALRRRGRGRGWHPSHT